MTLRRKTWIIISMMFLGLIVILYFLTENILLNGYRGAPVSIPHQEATVAFLILVIVAVGLVFGLATLFLLEKQVLSRLTPGGGTGESKPLPSPCSPRSPAVSSSRTCKPCRCRCRR